MKNEKDTHALKRESIYDRIRISPAARDGAILALALTFIVLIIYAALK